MTSYLAFVSVLMVASVHICVIDSTAEKLAVKEKLFEDINDYVLELRERTDLLTYLTKIQKIFCPEQPICEDGQTIGTNNDTFLLENLYMANESMQVKDLKYLVGVCCLPCSCSDRCSEDNNCCLSKDVASVTNVAVKSECVAATSISYQHIEHEPGLMYYMINHCFRNDTDMSTISKCESPDRYVLGDTIPVTSLTTGRTYWNTHCAMCNADADDVLTWNSTITFDRFILHSFGSHIRGVMPQTVEEMYTYLQKQTRSTVMYTPPLPMQHKVCIRDKDVLKCTDQGKELAKVDDRHSFILEACNQYSSQVLIGSPREAPYKNIFCFFCRKTSSNRRTSCNADYGVKGQTGQISALLDYRKSREEGRDVRSSSGLAGALRGSCACSEVFDKNHGECRPVFCPPGEILGTCRCVTLMSNITGMRVFLRLKVEPKAGQTLPSSEAKQRKMRIALRKLLKTTSKGNDAEILATFKNTNSDRPYYFVIATVTSTPGNDIKEATKPFLDYLDDSNPMEITFDKTTFMVRLTKEVRFKPEYNGTFFFTAEEKKGKSELAPQYLKESLQTSTTSRKILLSEEYQLLSPLLFCLQVQLDGNEYQENDGMLRLNTTTLTRTVYDYIRVDDTHARVCLEEYLQVPMVSSGAGPNLLTISLLALRLLITAKCRMLCIVCWSF